MFTAHTITGPAGLKGLQGLALLGSLALLPHTLRRKLSHLGRRAAPPVASRVPVGRRGLVPRLAGLPGFMPASMPGVPGSLTIGLTSGLISGLTSGLMSGRAPDLAPGWAAARLGTLRSRGPLAGLAGGLAQGLTRLAQALQQRGEAWQRDRERRDTERALRGLDPRLLRDIGFSCSEISSVAAEAAGTVEATRLRVLAGRHIELHRAG